MTQQPDVNKVYTGESVSFKCKVELSTGWEYSWYKDGRQLPINSSSFNIRGAHLLNGGTYECMAIRNETMYDTERSDGRILRIYGEPKLLCVDVLWCVLFRRIMRPSSVIMDFMQQKKMLW